MPDNKRQAYTKLEKTLDRIEKIVLAALIISIVLDKLSINALVLTELAVGGLAVIFFFRAYAPPEMNSDVKTSSFFELLILTIIPKVLWISCSVSAMGILFYLLQFGNEGYLQMALIGGMTMAASFILLVISMFTKTNDLRPLYPVLIRTAPLFFMDLYIYL